MKLTIPQADLKVGLAMARRAAPNKFYIPALQGVLMETIDGRLSLRTTDLEATLTLSLSCRIEEEGRCLIPVALFADLAAHLAPEPVKLRLDKTALHVECANYKGKINGLDPEDFPAAPDIEAQWTVPGEMLAQAIKRTAYAASKDNSRPVLNGVFFNGSEDKLILVGVDGFRMAVSHFPASVAGLSAIVPAPKAAELGRLLDGKEPVEVGVSQNAILFRRPGCTYQSRLIEGQFVPYERIIPVDTATRVTVDTVAVSMALAQTEVNTEGWNQKEGSFRPVDLVIGESGIELHGDGKERGDGTATVDAAIEGPGGKICVSSDYLGQAIVAAGADSLILGFNTPATPLLLTVSDDSYRAVIMPMHKDR